MSVQETTQDADTKDVRINELTEENSFLFEQLHVVQEELEQYYHKLKGFEHLKGGVTSAGGSVAAVPAQAVEAMAENLKLRALLAHRQAVQQVESADSPAARLGKELIKGLRSPGFFLTLPFRLRRARKALERKEPPAELGGKSFRKVLEAHAAGGTEAVEKLLDSVVISSRVRADAYTALARHLMQTDRGQVVALARLACKTDPRPYRLKWLAFRLCDAGDDIAAEALLDMLPENISMSDSEKNRAWNIRNKAKWMRTQQARKALQTPQTTFKEPQVNAAGSSQLAELKKKAEQSMKEAKQAKEKQTLLLQQMNAQKKEAEGIAAQTAVLLKDLIAQFESDKAALARVMRVVTGTAAGR